MLHVEDIKNYIDCKIESIGDDDIHQDLEKKCNNDLTLNSKYAHLDILNLVNYMFYIEFDNQEKTQISLSRVHDDLLWVGDT